MPRHAECDGECNHNDQSQQKGCPDHLELLGVLRPVRPVGFVRDQHDRDPIQDKHDKHVCDKDKRHEGWEGFGVCRHRDDKIDTEDEFDRAHKHEHGEPMTCRIELPLSNIHRSRLIFFFFVVDTKKKFRMMWILSTPPTQSVFAIKMETKKNFHSQQTCRVVIMSFH